MGAGVTGISEEVLQLGGGGVGRDGWRMWRGCDCWIWKVCVCEVFSLGTQTYTHILTHTYIAGMCLLRVLPGYGEAVGTVSAKLQVVPKP